MAKFTKADEIYLPQSVGPKTAGGNLNSTFQVFQPTQGREVLYKNPQMNDGSTEAVQDFDRRIPLGTYTLNNRGTWEENNFNESTFQPYLNEEWESNKSYRLQTRESITVETIDGNITIPPSNSSTMGIYNEHNTGKFSVEALPFVINPNNDDIIHLDRYYDKEIDKENYELATEGKINLKLQANAYGRVPTPNNTEPLYIGDYLNGDGESWNSVRGDYNEESYSRAQGPTYGYEEAVYPDYLPELNFGLNIDIFSPRGILSGGAWFDQVIEDAGSTGENDGVYLFKLNWDDGSEIEYTDKPKLLERTTLFEHFYDNPGFYTISGVMYRTRVGYMTTWEKFETNILLNPSVNYELNLLDYNDFASIGGIDKNSAFVKSLYNMVGVDPLYPNGNARASEEVIEKLNTLDKIQILNVLGKVDYSRLNDSLLSIVSPYQGEIDGVDAAILGCTEVSASNYSNF